MIVDDRRKKCAILIDELLGQFQVVIKNLEANFRKVDGVAGATILGDGRIALILMCMACHGWQATILQMPTGLQSQLKKR